MHVSSFVYDFHLRYFQSFLESSRDQFPALDYVNIVQGTTTTLRWAWCGPACGGG
jgi:hypothetical protein